ncbi:hypothetical protein [Alistipes onderdonkii]|uniref:hypothetical protein n=1 Tax=Alistipes onderdonkii TaxID=328813 RepID=UPI0018A890D9|nr:hypothetical protein [Alistipes onderdonkii]
MVAFIILLLFCLVSVAGGYALRRVDWQAIERDNERYYTSDGYHVYYDRKILRRLRDKEQEAQEPNDEN